MLPLQTGLEVWTELCARAGVDTAHYDQDLESELKPRLGLDPSRSLREGLQSSGIDSTTFLIGLMSVARPFVLMFRDILAIAERIAATRGRDNLRMHFAFDANHAFDVDLNAFRVQVETSVSVLRPVSYEQWSSERLWRLWQVLSENAPQESVSDRAQGDLEEWIAEYTRGVWPSFDLAAPESDNAELDLLLERVMSLHSTVVKAARGVGERQEALNRFAFRSDGELEILNGAIDVDEVTGGLLRHTHSDHWSLSVARQAYRCAEFVRADPARAPELSTQLREVLDNPAPTKRTIEQILTELVDLLQLPVWRLRYELYSVWIFSRVAEWMEERGSVEFQFEDGVFDLPFRPKRLAILQDVEPQVHLWSEVRTGLSAPRGKGRKAGIQPDFILTTEANDTPTTAIGVIECKQYRSASRRNFSAALSDYARGLPTAEVLLVNYGPAPPTILDGVEAEFRSRVHLVGLMRPDSKGTSQTLTGWLDRVLNLHCRSITSHQVGAAGNMRFVQGFRGARCDLLWDNTPRDLDLYVHAPACVPQSLVSFRKPGSATDAPWVKLDRDAMSGHGPERMHFTRAMSGKYRVAVHQYSNDGALTSSGALVHIDLGDSNLHVIECPTEGSGIWWYVCDIDFDQKSIESINRLSDLPPFDVL